MKKWRMLLLALLLALLCGCAAVPEPEDELPPASAGASSEEPAEEISALPEEFAPDTELCENLIALRERLEQEGRA